MSEESYSITFLVDKELNDAIIKYCKIKRVNKSSFIRDLLTDKLIEEKYINKGGKTQ